MSNNPTPTEKMSKAFSLSAEQSIIGGLLLNSTHWEDIAEIISPSDFYHPLHRTLFELLLELSAKNIPFDLITVEQGLKDKGMLEDNGRLAYLTDLVKNTPSALNTTAYANIIKEHAIRRRLIAAGNELIELSLSPHGMDIKTILDKAEQNVFNLGQEQFKNNHAPKSSTDILMETLKRIERISKSNGSITGLDTGFSDLNELTSGLQPSDLIIIAARPSMGKTTFAMNICENVASQYYYDMNDLDDDGKPAKKLNKPVLVFSLEMPSEQLMMRTLSSLSNVEQTKIRDGKLAADEDWAKLSNAMSDLAERNNIYIDDTANLSPTELRSKARKMYKQCNGLSLIMVDYLQLMRVQGFSNNRTLEIAEISRSLKALAKELNIPVIALSQLNRSLEQRANKRPVNSDLRESGAIEQDADVIMFIYRDEVYNDVPLEDRGLAEIIISKQRNGPIGKVFMNFQGKYSRFRNYDGPQRNPFD